MPFPPGGPVDVLARALGEGFRERTGQTFVVDNKPGGATAIGATACKNADPDGYTFCLLTASTISLNPFLYANLTYDPRKDLEPLTNVVFTHQVMILHKSIPANTLRELVAYAKDNPDKLNFGSFGIGGDSHLVFEWLKVKSRRADDPHPLWRRRAGAACLRARRRASALIRSPRRRCSNASSRVSPSRLRCRRASRRRARRRAVVQRSPDCRHTTPRPGSVPSRRPARPRPASRNSSRHLAAVIKSQTFQERFIKLGGYDAVGNTPEEFRTFLAADRARGEELVKLSGVKIEQ